MEEVRALKEELLSERKETIERKMQKAEEKRQMQIKQIVRKAHEEEAKVENLSIIPHSPVGTSVVCTYAHFQKYSISWQYLLYGQKWRCRLRYKWC